MTQEPHTRRGAQDQDWSSGAQPLTRRFKAFSERVRAFDARRPRVWDAVLTLFFLGATLTDASAGWRNVAFDPDASQQLVVVMSLGFAIPAFWRRPHPFAAYLATLPFLLLNSWTGAQLQSGYLFLVCFFHIALRLPLRTLAWAFALGLVPLTVSAIRFPAESWDHSFLPTLYGDAIVALLGLAVRTRQEYTASLVERARQLEVERDQQAQIAAAAERTRIAREMHDIIGHNLSVITGLADGGKYAAAKNPERAGQALDAIATTSRQALAELRRLLGVLREDSPTAELAPQPSLSDLDALVEGVDTAGLPVRMTVEGRPDSVPAGMQLTVYRVVQEALTNTLKHGGRAATATVALAYGDEGVTATITDTGAGGGEGAHPAEGRGITGMRERTSLYEGTLETGPLPAPTGGWRVHMRLPHPRVPSPHAPPHAPPVQPSRLPEGTAP
ncbi:histidine kinase [Streptomyces sp. NPDC051907]|uniref:sensor histidine kinase n=1 Tax=Streptomyces sp. NPDC051907 TaxID=3155284 RepID=UPI0034403A93